MTCFLDCVNDVNTSVTTNFKVMIFDLIPGYLVHILQAKQFRTAEK